MKRLAKVLGFFAGIGAVAWAMRDRLITIAAPKEPTPPTFRVASGPATTDDLTSIAGIGPVFAARLAQQGIRGFADLAAADLERVAHVAGVPEAKAADWIQQAADRG